MVSSLFITQRQQAGRRFMRELDNNFSVCATSIGAAENASSGGMKEGSISQRPCAFRFNRARGGDRFDSHGFHQH